MFDKDDPIARALANGLGVQPGQLADDMNAVDYSTIGAKCPACHWYDFFSPGKLPATCPRTNPHRC